jgi:putative endopeptidase
MTRLVAGATRAVSVLVLLAVAACGARPAAPPPASGIELANFDHNVRPQDDFYRYVNGTWLKTTQIPPDRSNYGSFTRLADEAEQQLLAIIQEAAAAPDRTEGSEAQKVGDLYASFMDEARLEGLGLAPLAAELARIDALAGKRALAAQFAHFMSIGVSSPVFMYVEQDAKDATRYIAWVGQAIPYTGSVSGLGLPNREYYLSPDPKFVEIRQRYREHVEKTLALAGIRHARAAAGHILALETRIAKIHWTAVEDRDDDKVYNLHSFEQLRALTPKFDWDAYVKQAGIEKSPGVIVRQPSYFKDLQQVIAAVPLAHWRAYLKWHLLRNYSDYLSSAFVDRHFDFYGRTLRGAQENRPRWKRGVAVVEASLGEALGKIYVERHFPPASKARMQELVANLKKAYAQSIRELEWMGPETRQRALEKLARFNVKIGYPDKWKDYSGLAIRPDDLLGNVMRSRRLEFGRDVAKLGGPIDRDEWGMTPQTVNAYYNPGLNEIVFPAAILQPPFFNAAAEDAVNYGGIGAVIGHEIGHGFDDQGSKYDGDGNLKSWWTEADRAAFEQRTQRLIAQYDAYEPLPGHRVNGALTIGENIGDLGGASIAYKAYRLSLGGREPPVLDGYTGDQRFFIGWAQVWARLYREQALLERVKTDPHSPSEYRANGPLVNLPEFHAAFGVREGDRMYLPPEQRVRIW